MQRNGCLWNITVNSNITAVRMPPTLNVCKRHKLKSAEYIKAKLWLRGVCYIPSFRGTMYIRRTIPHGLKIKNKGECKQHTTHQELVLGQVPIMTVFIYFYLFLLFTYLTMCQLF